MDSVVDDIDSDEEDGDEDAEEELSAQVRCVVLVLLHSCTVRWDFFLNARPFTHDTHETDDAA